MHACRRAYVPYILQTNKYVHIHIADPYQVTRERRGKKAPRGKLIVQLNTYVVFSFRTHTHTHTHIQHSPSLVVMIQDTCHRIVQLGQGLAEHRKLAVSETESGPRLASPFSTM